jgi:hypothetical protein
MDLNPEQKEFFSTMGHTFDTPGWTLLTQGWQSEIDSLPLSVFYNAKTMEDIEAARERVKLLNELIALPAVINMQRDQIDQMDDADG